jgi:hypothetical protein
MATLGMGKVSLLVTFTSSYLQGTTFERKWRPHDGLEADRAVFDPPESIEA